MQPDTPSTQDNISMTFDSQEEGESSQRKGKGKPGRKRLPEGPRTPSGWRYRIKKDLSQRQAGHCAECQEKKELCLYRSRNGSSPPNWSDYVLLCQGCRTGKRREKEEKRREARENQRRRREEQLRTEVWTRTPGKCGGSPESSKLNFLNFIRSQIFQRDGHRCVFCQTGKDLGLSPLIPESRGGQVTYSNYVCCCQRDRASKGRQFPLEFILKREFYPYCTTSDPEDEITVHKSAAGTRISLYLVAEVSRFLHRLAADKNGEISQFLSRIMANNVLDIELKIEAERLRNKLNELDRELRSKAEQLQIKLNETPEDKAKRRKAERASMNSWVG